MHLVFAHPALLALVGYWLLAATVDGMPAPTDKSSLAYRWLHDSLNALSGNLRKVLSGRFPQWFPLPAPAAGDPAGAPPAQ